MEVVTVVILGLTHSYSVGFASGKRYCQSAEGPLIGNIGSRRIVFGSCKKKMQSMKRNRVLRKKLGFFAPDFNMSVVFYSYLLISTHVEIYLQPPIQLVLYAGSMPYSRGSPSIIFIFSTA